jgi:hypothetical protein
MKKLETPIKLYVAWEQEDGTQGLQSQSYIEQATVDFIKLPNGDVMIWGHGPQGLNWYKFDGEYIITRDLADMRSQQL